MDANLHDDNLSRFRKKIVCSFVRLIDFFFDAIEFDQLVCGIDVLLCFTLHIFIHIYIHTRCKNIFTNKRLYGYNDKTCADTLIIKKKQCKKMKMILFVFSR